MILRHYFTLARIFAIPQNMPWYNITNLTIQFKYKFFLLNNNYYKIYTDMYTFFVKNTHFVISQFIDLLIHINVLLHLAYIT